MMQREAKKLNTQALLATLFVTVKTWHLCSIPCLHASPFSTEPKGENSEFSLGLWVFIYDDFKVTQNLQYIHCVLLFCPAVGVVPVVSPQTVTKHSLNQVSPSTILTT